MAGLGSRGEVGRVGLHVPVGGSCPPPTPPRRTEGDEVTTRMRWRIATLATRLRRQHDHAGNKSTSAR